MGKKHKRSEKPSSPRPLRILLSKRADGVVIFRCERPDGTATWQRGNKKANFFFAFHDLTHYAVETTLGWKRGFYGLLAEGWSITDFGEPWPRGRIPSDAEPAEFVVGMLDLERVSGFPITADECNKNLAAFLASWGAPCPWTITEDQFTRMRTKARSLWTEWELLPAGGTIELAFTTGVATP
jgi:hypothetical protein